MNIETKVMEAMSSHAIGNYIVPGLVSSVLGRSESGGLIRMFHCTRTQLTPITPHSHRFDLTCCVLSGVVTNIIWKRTIRVSGESFTSRKLTYMGEAGQYEVEAQYVPGCRDMPYISRWSPTEYAYVAGDWYHMNHDEIHSIYFSAGAKVLLFEGPSITDETIALEPVVGSEVIPTLKTEDWMFTNKKEGE